MTSYSESLTLRIEADASQFHAELDRVLGRVGQLSDQLQGLGRSQSGLNSLASSIQRLTTPLNQVSSLLTRITNQLKQLNNMAINVNVSPALQSLSRLSAAIQQVAAQMRSISAGGGGTGGSGGGGVPWGMIGGMLGGGRTGGSTPLPSVRSGGTSRMNHGGLVTGPGGMDRVPALLTAGEFVVQKSAVEREGRGFWERLNRGGANETGPTSNVTQYGEINIHLTQMAPLGDVLRDLQLEGHRLAKRRG
ncbi:hypothetical protein [Rubinisphaera brasiliensis]|uniref:Uncharacterized protein n=1 Tax=Rubinisphaera brasiliensis (strain ATCC 49424 / DSM 5305 / JCM 21570 / IAM 15109 / NBRC 103401 / IFAM 1448) TaxID=756272 RepID=F0SKQ4_RUBBR|nr:hypothetical protein [Rubinisphaera brasiliensis]ADY58724.1 hypothetical protein Plabr_1106 [Rubinisphaera brasiliensis DSM 5305]